MQTAPDLCLCSGHVLLEYASIHICSGSLLFCVRVKKRGSLG